ncbi:vegetative incompatibility protein HET-E-1 [Rhypophila decipiens]|uniref:Vegetative incompatibility protein HET-E-1 n=1 Tax=Rhypophila decipiens TaxID=261697 RepID=A0AAN6Y7P7_9PEZI|nr:vegetative incompatibility protein HET-E-1 [Rhypophila decipiens]
MEGLEALALEGNVIQFVEFAFKFVSRVHNIYTEARDEGRNRVRLQNMLKDFVLVAARLDRRASGIQVDNVHNKVQGISVRADGAKLQDTMRILAAHSTVLGLYMPRDTTLNSPEMVMAQNYLEELLKQLKVYQDNLQFHVLISVRESIEFLSQRQNDQFLESNAVLEKLVESYQNAISRDGDIASTIVEQHDMTRREIKDAIVETLRSLKLGESAEFDLELLAPPEVIRKSAQSYAEALLREEAAILNSLKFSVMLDREEDISKVEKKTFDWVFEDPKPDDLLWSNFRAWLRADDPLYWITGEAGSGKSTLMKYIFCHTRTRREILLWATSDQPLIIAGFFFWNAGSLMQKTQQGLFRSLLYQILSNHRELIPLVRSEIGFNKPDDLGDTWTNSRLERVFRKLVSQSVKAVNVILFIDGLDEYAGSHADLTALLKDLSSAESVKVCASSRPYIAFQNAFGKYPSLMLQNLTYRDIKTYVTTKFSENAHMSEVQRRESETVHLAKEVVEKAAGVFLWVKLVVKSLLEGLGSFDRLSDLRRRLEDLPDDLEDLYWHILRSVKPAFYLEQAAKLLLIAYHAGKHLTLLQLAYADLEDPRAAIKANFDAFSTEEQIEMANFMRGRMKTRCLDLIEVPASSSSALDIRYRTVQFMHQSVADFLATAQVKARLEACLSRQPTFNPYSCLMKASIVEMKHLKTVRHTYSNNQPATYLADIWYTQTWRLIWQFIHYAKLMGKYSQFDPETLVELMNELDRAANHLWHVYTSAECSFEVEDDVHWSEMRFEGRGMYDIQKHGSMQAFALENGLHSFVVATVKTMTKAQIKYALLVDKAVSFERAGLPTPEDLDNVRSVLKEFTETGLTIPLVQRFVRWFRLAFESPQQQLSRYNKLNHIRKAHAQNPRAGFEDKATTHTKLSQQTNYYISRTVFGAGA